MDFLPLFCCAHTERRPWQSAGALLLAAGPGSLCGGVIETGKKETEPSAPTITTTFNFLLVLLEVTWRYKMLLSWVQKNVENGETQRSN